MKLCINLTVSFLLLMSVCYADEKLPRTIPEPLTLNDALMFAEEPHPSLSTANLNLQTAMNIKREAETENDFNAYLEGSLSYVEPSPLLENQANNDSRAGIVVSKTIYDFGRSEVSIHSADFGIEAQEIERKKLIQQRRYDIMLRFFDVILADMTFYRYNEEMATAYISLDRLRDRLRLGQTSDIEVMQQDVEYNRIRYLRIKSENGQRITRAKLALAMGRPNELSATVTKPVLDKIKIKLPEIEDLQQLALKNNYQLKALNFKLLSARANVELARNLDNPTLSLEAESYAYSRDLKSREEFQVGLVLRIPIFSGTKSDIATAKALSLVHLIEADIESVKNKVFESILVQWLEFESLSGKLLQMKAQTDYRELYLDRSRALYEMEVKTDLGDAMVRVSEAEREYLQTQYQMMLALTKIELELGQQLESIPKATDASTSTTKISLQENTEQNSLFEKDNTR